MNTSLNHGTAKIYQFPVGGRAALVGQRTTSQVNTDIASVRSKAVATSGWYHEAAVQEAEQTREH